MRLAVTPILHLVHAVGEGGALGNSDLLRTLTTTGNGEVQTASICFDRPGCRTVGGKVFPQLGADYYPDCRDDAPVAAFVGEVVTSGNRIVVEHPLEVTLIDNEFC